MPSFCTVLLHSVHADVNGTEIPKQEVSINPDSHHTWVMEGPFQLASLAPYIPHLLFPPCLWFLLLPPPNSNIPLASQCWSSSIDRQNLLPSLHVEISSLSLPTLLLANPQSHPPVAPSAQTLLEPARPCILHPSLPIRLMFLSSPPHMLCSTRAFLPAPSSHRMVPPSRCLQWRSSAHPVPHTHCLRDSASSKSFHLSLGFLPHTKDLRLSHLCCSLQ